MGNGVQLGEILLRNKGGRSGRRNMNGIGSSFLDNGRVKVTLGGSRDLGGRVERLRQEMAITISLGHTAQMPRRGHWHREKVESNGGGGEEEGG